MELNIEIEEVGEDAASDAPDGVLRDVGEDGVAELRKYT